MNILMITNMYPNKSKPYFGRFVFETQKNIQKKHHVEIIGEKNSNSRWLRIIDYILLFIRILLKQKKYDCLYFHYPTRTSIPLLFLKNQCFILNFHGTDLSDKSKLNQLLVHLLSKRWKNAKLIVVPSEYLGEKIKEKVNLDYVVSPSAGVPDFFFESKLSNSRNEKCFYLSSITEDKGAFDLCEAIILLQKRNFYFEVDFYGTSDKVSLEKLNYYMALSNGYIKYKGHIEHVNIPKKLSSYKLHIFPSKNESLGLVGIESLSIGVPVLGPNLPSTVSYVKDNYNGLIFTPGNIDDLANKIFLCYNDEKLYQKILENCRESVMEYKQSQVGTLLNKKITDVLTNI